MKTEYARNTEKTQAIPKSYSLRHLCYAVFLGMIGGATWWQVVRAAWDIWVSVR